MPSRQLLEAEDPNDPLKRFYVSSPVVRDHLLGGELILETIMQHAVGSQRSGPSYYARGFIMNGRSSWMNALSRDDWGFKV